MDQPVTLLQQVLATLRAHRSQARQAGVELVGVVGSVARDDMTADSDIDVVFDTDGQLDYWRLGGVQMDLQDALGRRVDLVDRGMMPPERWRYMAQDFVPL